MTQENELRTGDYVRISRYYEADEHLLAKLRDTRAIGRVIPNRMGIAGIVIRFQHSGNARSRYEINRLFQLKDLELADIAALDSSHPADLADPDILIDEPVNTKPLLLASRTDYGWSVKKLVGADLVTSNIPDNPRDAEIAALDSAPPEAPDPYNWTPEDLAVYDPDEPIPPYKPGRSADDTIGSYKYEVAALKARNAELEALVERFKTLYDLMIEVDGQLEIQDRLFDPDSDDALEAWGEWICLMDSDVGIMQQYNRAGMYAPDEPVKTE